MTKILIDRAVVEQALEALELYVPKEDYENKPVGNVMDALRAALAEPQEPDSPERRCGGPGCDMRCCQPVQEPVAKVELMTTGGNAGLATRIVEIDDHLRERLRPGQLLYTAPPQRKPLTDEQIDDLYRTHNETPGLNFKGFARKLARAVERAHGIK